MLQNVIHFHENDVVFTINVDTWNSTCEQKCAMLFQGKQ